MENYTRKCTQNHFKLVEIVEPQFTFLKVTLCQTSSSVMLKFFSFSSYTFWISNLQWRESTLNNTI